MLDEEDIIKIYLAYAFVHVHDTGNIQGTSTLSAVCLNKRCVYSGSLVGYCN